MSSLRTLNELNDLEQSGFGRPSPRHGLKLLHWFANDFVFFNNNNKMCWNYNPKNQFYGFHRFKNRKNKNSDKLLPVINFAYYIVGNLNSEGAGDLPDYVREDYGGFKNGNNMDRIIVSLNGQCLDRVYVTEHCDRRHFKKEATYCISKDLILIISDMTLEDFLLKTGYSRALESYGQRTENSRVIQNDDHNSEEDGDTYHQDNELTSLLDDTDSSSNNDDNKSINCSSCVIL